LRAFDVGAVDFLLKPFDEIRLARALERSVARGGRAGADSLVARTAALVRQLDGDHGLTDGARLTFREDSHLHYLPLDEIAYLRADGNYVLVVTAGRRYQTRRALDDLARDLPSEHFVRVHRSVVVNIAFVRELQPCMHGDYLIHLRDGTQLRLSRRRREAI